MRWSRLFGQFSPIYKWRFYFLFGRRWSWRAVEVDGIGGVAMVPVWIDR